ncbi:hypothetical protein GCM10009804_53040 [Kribbella hippodromi]|uniref:Uncharacterized protein n=1 Tax=Kribbella hippodromi TaxID=434347 RepID=A0ABP4PSN5_9ACTN
MTVGAGYLALVVVGLLLGYPVVIGDLLVRQVVGRILDAPWAPFGADPEGKTGMSVIIVFVIGLPLVVGAVAIGKAIRRRISAGRAITVIHLLASTALLLLGVFAFRPLVFS